MVLTVNTLLMMQRILFLIVVIAPMGIAYSQLISDTHLNILLNTSFTANSDRRQFKQLSGKVNYLKWELKGKFYEDFSFQFRQSLTKKSLPAATDKAVASVDYANITWQVADKWSLKAGKQLLCLGGYEFWVSGYKVKEFSAFNDNMNNYGTGLTLCYELTPRKSLSFQLVGSKVGNDDETFCYGLPEGMESSKVPLLATFNYEGFSADQEWQLRYSLSAGQQAARCNLLYFTAGHVWRHKKVLAYWDVNCSYEGLDHKGLVSSRQVTARHAYYFTTIADVDYRFSSHWNFFVKGIYENGGVARAHGHYGRGTCFHEYQAQVCAEYFPRKELDLKIYLLVQHKERFTTSRFAALGIPDSQTQKLMLGVVYAIPVF